MISFLLQKFSQPLAALLMLPGVVAFVGATETSPDNNQELLNVLWSDVQIGLSDAAGFYTAPLSWDEESLVHAVVFVGATAGAFAADEEIREEALEWNTSGLNQVFYSTELLGQLRGWQYASGAMYVTGWLSGDSEVRILGRLMIESIILGGATAIVVQTGLGRARPFEEEGAFSFHTFSTQERYLSFPSGHAVVAFGMASVLAERVDEPVFDVVVYGLATVSVAGRVFQDKHWLSDVVVGSAIGLASGLYVSHREQERSGKQHPAAKERFSWNIVPTMNGLHFTMKL